MKRKRLLAWLLTFAMIAGMFVAPASAEGNTTTITQDTPSGTMTITLEITGTLSDSNVTLSADSFTYNGSTQKPTITVKHQRGTGAEVTLTEDTDYTVSITDSSNNTVTEPTTAGTYTVTVTGKGVYSGTVSKTYSITASTPSAPAAPTAASATKNSITLNAVSGCEYSKDGTNWQDSAEFTDLRPGTEYTFYQRVKATANTNASSASSASFSTEADTYAMTIMLEVPKKNPAATDLSYTAPTNLVYSGSDKTATVAAASGVTGIGDITVKYYSDAERATEVTETKNVGTYYVGATVTGGDNYNASTGVLYGDGWTFTITASTPDAPAAPTKASATKNSITLTAVDGCEYSKDGTSWQSSAEFTGLLPNTAYTFYQRLKATANTNASAASTGASFSTELDTYAMTITLVIVDKDTQTITASNVTATYGDTNAKVSASTNGNGAISYAVKSGGDVVEVNSSTGALTIKKVGTATITVTAAETSTGGTGDKGYAKATKEVTVTISPKAMTVSASGYSGYYDGSAHGITVTVSDPATGATVKYGTTEGTYDLDTSPTLTAAGTKTVYYQVTADNYTTYTGSATISISAKQPQTITASNVTATYGNTNAKVSATTNGNGALSYAVKSGDAVTVNSSTGALNIVKAGTAIVTVTAAETTTYTQATKDVTVTVNKATPSYTVPTGLTATYGQTLADVALPVGWTWADSSTGVGSTGTHTFKAGFTPTDTANYNTVSDIDITVTVGKATASAATAPAANELTYNGTAQPLVSAGTANGGTMQYALGTSGKAAPTAGYVGAIPVGKDAGTYYVWYKVTGDESHNDSEPACVSVTIAKSTMTPAPKLRLVTVQGTTYTDKTSWVYGETDVVPYVEGNISGGVVTTIYTVDGKEQTQAPTDAGSYTVKAKIAATANYNGVEATNSVSFTITKAPHSDMTAAQTVSVSRSGVTGATLDLGAYLADAASWSVKSTDGTLITSAAKGDGAVLTYTAAQTTAVSATGNVLLTVTMKNYADYTLTVNFRTAAAFTLRFESNGGTEIPSRILSENAVYGTLPVLTRSGYSFGGWYTDAALKTPATAETSIGSADATVYAKWTVDSHTITLNLNGHGTLDKTTISYSAADSDFNLPVPADVTGGDSTWTFGGWQKDGGTAQINVTIQTAALEDATYNALWVEGKKEGEVTFTKDADANTGLMGLESMDEGTVSTEGESSDTPAQSLADVMKEVACAESKAEEADKTVTVAMDVQPVNTNSGELAEETQTAIEKIKEQSGSGSDEKVKDDLLTIEVQKTTAPTSGSGEVTTEKLTDIGRVVEIPLQYNMTGRYQPRIFRFHDNVAAAFVRLATRPVGGFRDGTYFVSGVGASAVIYIYTEKFSTYSITTTETPTHTVMFETNGGSAMETVTIEDQQTIDPPTAPTKDSGDAMISYVFDGWYSSSDFSTVYDFSTKVTKDLTLYAKWREIVVYTITFNPNEGTVSPASGITNAEGKLATLPTPTRGGYIFNGWYDAQTGGSRVTADTVFTENSTVYARWTKTGGSNTPGSVYSGSSSSSDSDDTRYKVTTGETQHGTVSVSSTSTSSGTKVTITAKPDTGYTVDTVTVTGANGRNVTVTKVNDTTYTYIQPGMDVKTDVTFKAAQSAPASTAEVFARYSDLDASGWYADGVRYALENGIMSGYGNGKFGPGDTTSRAMIAQILYNLEGKPAYSGMLNYTDVDANDWYAAAIRWANAEGIIDGYGNNLFGPNDVLTREQLVTILYRYAKSKGVDVSGQTSLTGYHDAASVSGWAEDAMQWAVAAGIITGKGHGTLDPKGNATRSEIATIMMRYCENAAK